MARRAGHPLCGLWRGSVPVAAAWLPHMAGIIDGHGAGCAAGMECRLNIVAARSTARAVGPRSRRSPMSPHRIFLLRGKCGRETGTLALARSMPEATVGSRRLWKTKGCPCGRARVWACGGEGDHFRLEVAIPDRRDGWLHGGKGLPCGGYSFVTPFFSIDMTAADKGAGRAAPFSGNRPIVTD